MGIFGEGREKFENSEGKYYALNQSAPTGSPGHDETLSFNDNVKEHRELVPSMENPFELEVHAEETIMD